LKRSDGNKRENNTKKGTALRVPYRTEPDIFIQENGETKRNGSNGKRIRAKKKSNSFKFSKRNQLKNAAILLRKYSLLKGTKIKKEGTNNLKKYSFQREQRKTTAPNHPDRTR
jgi:hypothetical protein